MTRSQVIASLVGDISWFENLELMGVPLDPDKGEVIIQLAERIADNLQNKGLIKK